MRESITYSYGQIPIIISCVHDGSLKLDIPVRQKPNSINGNDLYMYKISTEICKNLSVKLKYEPYYIYNNIQRKYFDLNRECKAGTENPVAVTYWNNFHDRLTEMIEHCLDKHKHCLLLDLHGNIYTTNVIQLGYGVSDENIVKYKESYESTLSYLNKIYTNNSLIYNERSLSSFIKNTPVFPTFNTNLTGIEKYYYDGGYLIRSYSKKFNIDCIQVELSENLRKYISIDFIEELTNAIILFYFTNYYPLFKKKMKNKLL